MEIYIAVMVTLCFLAIASDVAITMLAARKSVREYMRERTDAKVEKAERKSEADLVSEGFENIMTFSVRGKTGFEDQ